MRKETKINLILLGGTIILCVILLEMTLPFFLPLHYDTVGIYATDNQLGWGLKTETELQNDLGKNEFAINEEGYRGPIKEHQEGKTNILVLADSFGFGGALNVGERFSEQMETENIDFNVINLGVGGYGTDQERLLYTKVKEKYNPEIVILLLYTENDFSDNKKKEGKPYYTITNNEFTLNNYPIQESVISETKSFKKTILKKSELYRLITTIVSNNPQVDKIAQRLNLGEGHSNYCKDLNKNVFAKEMDTKITTAIIEDLAKEVIKDKKTLIVGIIPADYQVQPKRFWKSIEAFGCNKEDFDLEKPNKILGAFLKEKEILFIDFLPEFKQTEEDTYIPAPDRHLNKEGNKILAKKITEKIRTILQ
jgi:hypothetical protein